MPRTRVLLEDGTNELIFSPASLWEVAIKQASRRVGFPFDAGELHRALLLHHFTEMPVTGTHAVYIARLPLLHKDPFDRILIAQAIIEGVILLTPDKVMGLYSRLIQRA
ncbi:hypothetical protein ACZ75_24700 [Massilia sp. NR 4-1]|nr:hypothetical protein ACZ75_24700 [Massilia sp. NR 4-1]